MGSRNRRAHRVAYELIEGPIPDGLQLDHLCRVRRCINPAHLEPVTAKTNMARSPISIDKIRAARTHCEKGHEYTPENTATGRRGNGRLFRVCKTCNRENQKRYRERNGLRGKGNANKRKTHCPRGHPYDEANTYVDQNGYRVCRACARERQRARYRLRDS